METPAARLYHISHGNEGVRETLHLMAELAREYRRHPAVIELARMATLGVPARDAQAEAVTLMNFVRAEVRYVPDVRDVELIMTPERLFTIGAGDCDDLALALAALLESLGIATRFVAMGENGSDLTHVYVEAQVNGRWLALDATEPHPAGWRPGAAGASYVVPV